MRLPLRSLPSFRATKPTVEQIQAHHLPMGPPSHGTDPVAYWLGIARDQMSEFSVSQRLNARRAGKSLDLLSAEVRRGLLAHNASPVNAVLLVHTPSVKRAASVAYNRLERGVGSVSRRLSTRRKPVQQPSALQAALDKTPAPLKSFGSQHSMVPSIFAVQGDEPKVARRVRFADEVHNLGAIEPAAPVVPIKRRATAPSERPVTSGAHVDLRPSRTLPSRSDVRPPKNTQPPRAEDTGLIMIRLAPELSASQSGVNTALRPSTPTPAAKHVPTSVLPDASISAPINFGPNPNLKLITLPPIEPLVLRHKPHISNKLVRHASKPVPTHKAKASRDDILNSVIDQLMSP